MKKILLALAVLATFQVATAQDKSASAIKAYESALKATENAKKAANPATWIKVGETLMSAYEAPAGNGMIGMDQQNLQMIMAGNKPQSVEEVTIGGQPFTKQVYPAVNYYINADGVLAMIEVTKPAVENALDKAADAFKKAAELDTAGKNEKKIAEGINGVADKYAQEATQAYSFGNYLESSKYFDKIADLMACPPVSKVDSTSIYNSGLTAYFAQDFDKAKKSFEKCKAIGYYTADGDVYAKLADIAQRQGDNAGMKAALEEGFEKFPGSQAILVGLINYYMSNGENPEKLFDLLGAAKKNDPKNASLWYVEGQAYEKLGRKDEALQSYAECSKVNPDYVYGYIGAAILLGNKAQEFADKAYTEMDNKKYEALIGESNKNLAESLDLMLKAYEVSKDENLKVSVANVIKEYSFQLRNTDPKYMEINKKFNEILGNN